MSQAAAAAAQGDPESFSGLLCFEGDGPAKRPTHGKLQPDYRGPGGARGHRQAPGQLATFYNCGFVPSTLLLDTGFFLSSGGCLSSLYQVPSAWDSVVCGAASQAAPHWICTGQGEADLIVHTPILQVKKLRHSRVE